MTEKPSSQGSRGWGVGIGILIGVAGTILLIVLVVLISFLAMGRCPMCGRMMDNGMMDNGMMDNGMMDNGMMDNGMMDGGEMPGWMMSREGRGGGMMRDMRLIHTLLRNHEEIEREVEDIPDGIRATTTSSDPDTAEALRTHVRQMKERIEQGQPIRMMDPVFRELFEHNDEIEMEIEEVPGGVRVTETSDKARVVLLIRQHAHRAVSEFVEGGRQRAMQPTPLPEGYNE